MYITPIFIKEIIAQLTSAREMHLAHILKNPNTENSELKYWIGRVAAFDEIIQKLQTELDKSYKDNNFYENIL